MQFLEEDVFWVSGPTVHIYSSLHHSAGLTAASKFLGYQLPNGRCFIIVSSDSYHDRMVEYFAERIKYMAGDVDRLSEYSDAVDLMQPIVAGNLKAGNDKIEVTGWRSMGFGVVTPHEHRTALKVLLEVPLLSNFL